MTTLPPPANPRLRAAVESMSPAEREWFEERAGILQFENDLPVMEAEAIALRQVKR